ncbi:RNA polymerase sigma factor WhiG [Sanguibacter suaedae]|uniref:RNA polymerase sigma factor n=1 Tax=Sanguibacter suaedae TaxID=2795737 RepID=A0A934IEN3_9MICO|nr:RNA polymerase sigma factor WhiG [Sanguibacter suaedae]MBI9115554.1 RNA polymerase sigma factor WhiG [Sanguibacter suaedae]
MRDPEAILPMERSPVPVGTAHGPTSARPAARSGLLHARLDSVARPASPPPGSPSGRVEPEVCIADVWEHYKRTGAPALREQLILHYAPLVAMVASRVGMRLPSSVEHADLVSYGMFGLIDAIEKFETGRDVKFETYAGSRVRGAILDELRAVDWIPRSVRSKARSVDRAYAELEAELHRAPSDDELASRMEISVAELRGIQNQVSNVNLVALDEVIGEGDRVDQVSAQESVQREKGHDPARTFEAKETKFLLSQAMDQLGEREKVMLVLYYYEGMTLAEIGRVLGVTESRISQMHTAAMGRLRARLTSSEHA